MKVGQIWVSFKVGVLHSFSIKNTFYDKIDLRFFYFRVLIYKNVKCYPANEDIKHAFLKENFL